MQAIVTKYLGPTNSRGSRVKATCQAGSVTISWEDAWDVYPNHRAAALALVTKLGWDKYPGEWLEGSLPDDTGYAFILVPGKAP